LRRRQFITLLGSAATWPILWPLAARAQQAALPVIGLLGGIDVDHRSLDAFQQGLGETGFISGKNVAIEYRSAAGQYDRLPALAADLVLRRVNVMLATGGSPSALAAKAASTTIPIVFVIGADPVKLGLVASINRPGGNITGVSFLINALVAKRLELLRELLPQARTIGLLVNTASPNTASDTRDVQAAADMLGRTVDVVNASNDNDFDPAFASLARRRADALFVFPDPFLFSRVDRIVALSARHALPAIYDRREAVDAGGLVSYGTSLSDAHRQAGVYIGRILKGDKPVDLPVMQPTKFELVINLKTAKALGLTVPPSLLATADEVIE
jgi:putative ABC transport system substrate-binding protein